jgi:hypothetical protein
MNQSHSEVFVCSPVQVHPLAAEWAPDIKRDWSIPFFLVTSVASRPLNLGKFTTPEARGAHRFRRIHIGTSFLRGIMFLYEKSPRRTTP